MLTCWRYYDQTGQGSRSWIEGRWNASLQAPPPAPGWRVNWQNRDVSGPMRPQRRWSSCVPFAVFRSLCHVARRCPLDQGRGAILQDAGVSTAGGSSLHTPGVSHGYEAQTNERAQPRALLKPQICMRYLAALPVLVSVRRIRNEREERTSPITVAGFAHRWAQRGTTRRSTAAAATPSEFARWHQQTQFQPSRHDVSSRAMRGARFRLGATVAPRAHGHSPRKLQSEIRCTSLCATLETT